MAKVRVTRDRTAQYLAKATREIEKAVEAGAILVTREAKRLVNRHTGPPPSAPGQPPHKRTGTLGRWIDFDKPTRTPSPGGGVIITARVGSNLHYARIHELGGTINHPGGSPYIVIKGQAVWIKKSTAQGRPGVKYSKAHTINMPARPYLRPALASQQKRIRKMIQAAALRARTPGQRRGR